MAEGGEGAQSFSDVCARLRPRLVRAAWRIARDQTEAEDTVQETLTRVWQLWREGAVQHPEAYLLRAVRVNALKRRARRRQGLPLCVIEGQAAASDLPPPEEDDPTAIDSLTLERALAGLPQTQQAVLRMRYYTGLTFCQIGAALDISVNTAASRCRYGLQALRAKLSRKTGRERATEPIPGPASGNRRI